MCRSVLAASAALMLTAAGCGEESAVDGKAAIGGLTPTTVTTFATQMYNGTSKGMAVTQGDTIEVNGETYTVFKIKNDAVDAPEGVNVYLNVFKDHMVFAGGEIFWGGNNSGVPNNFPFLSGTPDEPVTIDLDPPLNVDQTVHVVGTAFIGDPSDPANGNYVDIPATYRAVEKNTTVDTQLGTFSGVTKFTAETTIFDTVVNGVAWYHPDFGLLKGQVDWPAPNGSQIDLTGFNDNGSHEPGMNTIRKMQIVDSSNPNFEISTYDVDGEFDADRWTHARMLLEIRFDDDYYSMQSSTAPQPTIHFGTTWGSYDHMLVPSPISFFHPEENGKGYTFWIAYVDQAAKNAGTDPDTYHIRVTWNGLDPAPLRVTGRIIYRKMAVE